MVDAGYLGRKTGRGFFVYAVDTASAKFEQGVQAPAVQL
jgi:3-hydroxyacyl-CoA dehydrogenase